MHFSFLEIMVYPYADLHNEFVNQWRYSTLTKFVSVLILSGEILSGAALTIGTMTIAASNNTSRMAVGLNIFMCLITSSFKSSLEA